MRSPSSSPHHKICDVQTIKYFWTHTHTHTSSNKMQWSEIAPTCRHLQTHLNIWREWETQAPQRKVAKKWFCKIYSTYGIKSKTKRCDLVDSWYISQRTVWVCVYVFVWGSFCGRQQLNCFYLEITFDWIFGTDLLVWFFCTKQLI